MQRVRRTLVIALHDEHTFAISRGFRRVLEWFVNSLDSDYGTKVGIEMRDCCHDGSPDKSTMIVV